jgi:hypothetical protein
VGADARATRAFLRARSAGAGALRFKTGFVVVGIEEGGGRDARSRVHGTEAKGGAGQNAGLDARCLRTTVQDVRRAQLLAACSAATTMDMLRIFPFPLAGNER